MRIRVNGIPAPQGSKRHVGNGILVESSAKVQPWRDAVRGETQRVLEAGASPAWPGLPLLVELTFYLPRPKSTPKRVTFPAKRPDLDKLTRSTLDGLGDGGAYHDDAQIIAISTSKHFASDERPPGVTIYLVAADDLEAADLDEKADERAST